MSERSVHWDSRKTHGVSYKRIHKTRYSWNKEYIRKSLSIPIITIKQYSAIQQKTQFSSQLTQMC